MKKLHVLPIACALVSLFGIGCRTATGTEDGMRGQAAATMRKAATYYRTKVASHGGYVYYYSPDLTQRWGEGRARPDEIWVQPPGTPTVGMAYLKAYEATGDTFYLKAATDAAEALVEGQLDSGGWNSSVRFESQRRFFIFPAQRHGGISSLDDGQTQSAIKFLAHVDRALGFKNKRIHNSVQTAMRALLAAQFPNGAFPQGWNAPSAPYPVLSASYPSYDWRTEGRIKEYWRLYTLNDNVTAHVASTLITVYDIYHDARYLEAVKRLGDFLILAQMPDPQPAWAQQYSYDMKPVWARRFEPPAITGFESQGVLETLMSIYRLTGDRKYLGPIPRALAYLKSSTLPDGSLARYYELQTNTPLYMSRIGGRGYNLTYDDTALPSHYGWKFPSRLAEIEKQYNGLVSGAAAAPVGASPAELEGKVRAIIAQLDAEGRWITANAGERMVGQPNWQWQVGFLHISSEVFSRNVETLSEYLIALLSGCLPSALS